MAEETKPVDVSAETSAKAEEVVEETAKETPVVKEKSAEASASAKATADKPAEKVEEKVEVPAEEAPAEKVEDKPAAKADAKEDKRSSRQKDIFAVIEGDEEEVAKPKRRVKGAKNVPYGIAFIKTSFNNTIVSLTDMRGHVVSWSSAGRCGFKGSRKSTAFAATTVAQEAARGAISHGMNEVEIRVQGPGAGRESAVRAIQSAGLRVSAIKDTTPVPHNGCRPKKQRRV
ncbi:MAG: 30S ribosomal protein S11 [Victivallales bacterium]|nr:30S ribosomal protein S11 [Victivallales bacterium]